MLVVGLLLGSLLYLNMGAFPARKAHELVVFSVPITPPPPPKQPERRPVAAAEPARRIVAPPPIVAVPRLPTIVATTPAPPPVAVTAPAAPVSPGPAIAAPPPAMADGGDLSSRMIFAKPPSYPLESRRRHEEGTVVLSVLVSVDGLVSEISVARTSGSSLIDQAALNAVRKWRWAPLLRGGQPVTVRGEVRLPFVLKR